MGRRVVFDVTGSHRGAVIGGIVRVCSQLAQAVAEADTTAVAIVQDRTTMREFDGHTVGDIVSLAPGDVYAIMDSFWDPFDDYVESLSAAQAVGAITAVCVHDLLPLDMPGLVDPRWAPDFAYKFERILAHVDLVVAVSRTSLRRIRLHMRQRGFSQPIVWFHHGADAMSKTPVHERALHGPARFLSVGTIEPKKGYGCLIDAFEKVWAQNVDAICTIVGRRGWLCDATVARVLGHTEYGRRLIWAETASDAELTAMMATSRCLIQASVAEGFGLPLIEAAAAGLPIIASDLPVFREIAGDGIVYFRAGDSSALAARIATATASPPSPSSFPIQTWSQSADQLVRRLIDAADRLPSSNTSSAS